MTYCRWQLVIYSWILTWAWETAFRILCWYYKKKKRGTSINSTNDVSYISQLVVRGEMTQWWWVVFAIILLVAVGADEVDRNEVWPWILISCSLNSCGKLRLCLGQMIHCTFADGGESGGLGAYNGDDVISFFVLVLCHGVNANRQRKIPLYSSPPPVTLLRELQPHQNSPSFQTL